MLPGWLVRTPPTPRVEPLETHHAAALAAIHARAFARPWDELELERLLADRAVLADGLFVGRDREPAGFVLSRRVLDEAEILTVALRPDLRGQGCARGLLRRHLETLATAGVRTVHLEVEEGNAPALALYRRAGFQETGRRAGYYPKPDGTRAAALIMTSAL